jgi:type II secretory pathway pseudopilin PulG
MKQMSKGFTVIEIILVALIAGFAGVLFFVQKNNMQTVANDNTRKTAINAMYYSLEEVFFAKNGYYPQNISSDNLMSVDPLLFKDPSGNGINTSNSDYTYTPSGCDNNQCKKYQLKATLQNEADYIKTSKN